MTAATAPKTATPLLRRLRIQFIALNMTLATVVLAIAFATICYLDYSNAIDEVYRSLNQAANSTARTPQLTIFPDRELFAHPSDKPTREGTSNRPEARNEHARQSEHTVTITIAEDTNNAPASEGETGSANPVDASDASNASGANDASTTRDPNSAPVAGGENNADGESTGDATNAEGTNDPGNIDNGPTDNPDAPANPGAPADDPGAPQGGNSIGSTEGDAAADTSDNPDNPDDESFAPPQIGGEMRDERESYLPIAVYSCENGTAMLAANQSSASVPDDILPLALAVAFRSADDQGYSSDIGLFFVRQERASGYVVAFADDSAASSWQSLAWGLAAVGLIALAALFLINLRFSRWVLRPVETAWAQQQQFIADASHELKTPLTVILANNAILRSRPHDTIAEQAQWIESTQNEAERMQSLVTDMLDLARPTPEAHDAEPQPAVDLSRLVTGEVLQFESVAFERGLCLESEVAENLNVRGEKRRLERLVAVLLDNACKYAGPGGSITARLQRSEGNAVLAVTNTGDPIDPEDLPHLFDRFYRADKARTHNTSAAPQSGETAAQPSTAAADGTALPRTAPQRTAASQSPAAASPSAPSQAASRSETTNARPDGYGLGLAIARDIAHDHGGTITATSTAADGTTFTVKLPLA